MPLKRQDPYKEEDEGYLAALAGKPIEANPYPAATIRHDHWRRGWRARRAEDDAVDAIALTGGDARSLADNPHPKGTIRYEEWRRGWLLKQERARRASRLGITDPAR